MQKVESDVDNRRADEILQIIQSGDNEEQIAESLSQLLKRKSGLSTLGLDARGRHLFHTLVLHNKPKALTLLLQNETFHYAAMLPDQAGQTILHLAAANRDISREMPKIILRSFPELLNSQDRAGDAALHLAARQPSAWFVKLLAESPELKRMLANNEGETALSIAGANKELKHALFHLALGDIKSFDMRHKTETTESIESLRAIFPMLTSRSDSSHTPSTSSDSRSLSFSADEMPEIERMTDAPALKFSEFNKQLVALVAAFGETKSSQKVERLLESFYLSCQRFIFPDDLKLSVMLEKVEGGRESLIKILDYLFPHVERETTVLQAEMKRTIKELAYNLTLNGITEPPAALGAYVGNPEAEEVWWLVSCQDARNAERKFSYSQIEEKVLGTLMRHSPDNVLMMLRLLYSRFDYHQKLVANYVVAQLFLFDAANENTCHQSIASHFRFFIRFNVNKQRGLSLLGLEINAFLQKICGSVAAFSTQPLLHNFHLLKMGLQNEFKGKRSFSSLVESALALPRHMRALEVYAIARELKMLTHTFYQQVLFSEFTDGNWLDEEKKGRLAPHITEFMEASDKLRNYFIYTILNQTKNKIKRAFELLIDTTRALCPLDEENHPDLHHTMLFYTVFINPNISRLTKTWSALTESDRKCVSELKQLTRQADNYKFLRDICVLDRTALPCLMVCLADVYVADEGTKSLAKMQKARAFGAALSRLIEVKFSLKSRLVKHETDLPHFLKTYAAQSDKSLGAASLIHQQDEMSDVPIVPPPKPVRDAQLTRARSRSVDFFVASTRQRTSSVASVTLKLDSPKA